MSDVLVRLLLAVALVILLPLVYIEIYVLLWGFPGISNAEALSAATIGATVALLVGWPIVWARSVTWTRRRVVWTAIVTAVASVCAFLAFLLNQFLMSGYGTEIAIILAGMSWGALWIGGTALIWRETAAERAARQASPSEIDVACPRCGYNLRGLTKARCPECGAQFTLDQLYVSLLSRTGKLEDGA